MSDKPYNITDGDTFKDDRGQPIRLRGTDTPESTPRSGMQPGGWQATEGLRNFLEDGYELGPKDGETYGRDVHDVYNEDGERASDALIRSGLGATTGFSDEGNLAAKGLGIADDIFGRSSGDEYFDELKRSARSDRAANLQRMLSGEFDDRMAGAALDNLGEREGWVSRAFDRGTAQLKLSANAFVDAVGEVTGSDTLRDFGQEGIKNALLESAQNPAEVASWEDAEGLDDTAMFLAEAVVGEVPSLMADGTAALLTGGGSLAASAARRGIAKAFLRRVGGPNAAARAGEISNLAFKRGAKAGAFGSIYAQVSGESHLQQQSVGTDDGGRALLVGAGKASLDYLSLKGMLGDVARRFEGGENVDSIAKWFGSSLAATATSATREGITETTQTLMDELNKVELTDGAYKVDPAKLEEALVVGTAVGGTFGGVGGAAGNTLQYFKGADAAAGDGLPDRSNPTPEPPEDFEAKLESDPEAVVYVPPENVDDGVTLDYMKDRYPDLYYKETEKGGLRLSRSADAIANSSGKDDDATQASELGYAQSKQEVIREAERLGVEPVVEETLDDRGRIIRQEYKLPDPPGTELPANKRQRSPDEALVDRDARYQRFRQERQDAPNTTPDEGETFTTASENRAEKRIDTKPLLTEEQQAANLEREKEMSAAADRLYIDTDRYLDDDAPMVNYRVLERELQGRLYDKVPGQNTTLLDALGERKLTDLNESELAEFAQMMGIEQFPAKPKGFKAPTKDKEGAGSQLPVAQQRNRAVAALAKKLKDWRDGFQLNTGRNHDKKPVAQETFAPGDMSTLAGVIPGVADLNMQEAGGRDEYQVQVRERLSQAFPTGASINKHLNTLTDAELAEAMQLLRVDSPEVTIEAEKAPDVQMGRLRQVIKGREATVPRDQRQEVPQNTGAPKNQPSSRPETDEEQQARLERENPARPLEVPDKVRGFINATADEMLGNDPDAFVDVMKQNTSYDSLTDVNSMAQSFLNWAIAFDAARDNKATLDEIRALESQHKISQARSGSIAEQVFKVVEDNRGLSEATFVANETLGIIPNLRERMIMQGPDDVAKSILGTGEVTASQRDAAMKAAAVAALYNEVTGQSSGAGYTSAINSVGVLSEEEVGRVRPDFISGPGLVRALARNEINAAKGQKAKDEAKQNFLTKLRQQALDSPRDFARNMLAEIERQNFSLETFMDDVTNPADSQTWSGETATASGISNARLQTRSEQEASDFQFFTTLGDGARFALNYKPDGTPVMVPAGQVQLVGSNGSPSMVQNQRVESMERRERIQKKHPGKDILATFHITTRNRDNDANGQEEAVPDAGVQVAYDMVAFSNFGQPREGSPKTPAEAYDNLGLNLSRLMMGPQSASHKPGGSNTTFVQGLANMPIIPNDTIIWEGPNGEVATYGEAEAQYYAGRSDNQKRADFARELDEINERQSDRRVALRQLIARMLNGLGNLDAEARRATLKDINDALAQTDYDAVDSGKSLLQDYQLTESEVGAILRDAQEYVDKDGPKQIAETQERVDSLNAQVDQIVAGQDAANTVASSDPGVIEAKQSLAYAEQMASKYPRGTSEHAEVMRFVATAKEQVQNAKESVQGKQSKEGAEVTLEVIASLRGEVGQLETRIREARLRIENARALIESNAKNVTATTENAADFRDVDQRKSVAGKYALTDDVTNLTEEQQREQRLARVSRPEPGGRLNEVYKLSPAGIQNLPASALPGTQGARYFPQILSDYRRERDRARSLSNELGKLDRLRSYTDVSVDQARASFEADGMNRDDAQKAAEDYVKKAWGLVGDEATDIAPLDADSITTLNVDGKRVELTNEGEAVAVQVDDEDNFQDGERDDRDEAKQILDLAEDIVRVTKGMRDLKRREIDRKTRAYYVEQLLQDKKNPVKFQQPDQESADRQRARDGVDRLAPSEGVVDVTVRPDVLFTHVGALDFYSGDLVRTGRNASSVMRTPRFQSEAHKEAYQKLQDSKRVQSGDQLGSIDTHAKKLHAFFGDKGLRVIGGNKKAFNYEGIEAFVTQALSDFRSTGRPVLVAAGSNAGQIRLRLQDTGLLSDDSLALVEARLADAQAGNKPLYMPMGDFVLVSMPSKPNPKKSSAKADARWYHQLGHELGHLVFDDYSKSLSENRTQREAVYSDFAEEKGFQPHDDPALFKEWFADKAANEMLARAFGKAKGQAEPTPFTRLADKMEAFWNKLQSLLPRFARSKAFGSFAMAIRDGQIDAKRGITRSQAQARFNEARSNIKAELVDTNAYVAEAQELFKAGKITPSEYNYAFEEARRDSQRLKKAEASARALGKGNKLMEATEDFTAEFYNGPPAAGVNAKLKDFAKRNTAPGTVVEGMGTLVRTVIGRIEAYSPELASHLFQRSATNRNVEGVQAYDQMSKAKNNQWVGVMERAFQKVYQAEGIKGVFKGKAKQAAVIKAFRDFEAGRTHLPGARALSEAVEAINNNARQSGFRSTLLDSKAPPVAMNHFSVDKDRAGFAALMREAFPEASNSELNDRLELLLDTHGQSEFAIAPGLPVSYHDTSRRMIEALGVQRLRDAGFLAEPSDAVFYHYIDGLAKRTAWEANFGDYTDAPKNRLAQNKRLVGVNDPNDELVTQMGFMKDGRYYNPNGKFHKHMDVVVAKHGQRARSDILSMLDGVMGRNTSRMHPGIRNTLDWVTAWTSWTILSFSGVASIPELGLPFVRAHARVGILDGLRGLGEARRFAKDAGNILSDSAERIMWQTMGDNYESSTLNKIGTAFFKINGQTAITNMARTLGISVGTRYLLKSAEMGDTQALQQLGLTESDVHRWDAAGRPVWTPGAETADNAAAEKVQNALTQFMHEGSSYPSKFQNPGWFNNPYLKMFWMVKRYMYAYGEGILLGMWRQAKRQWMRGSGLRAEQKAFLAAAPFLAFAVATIPLAAVGTELRELMRPLTTGRPGKDIDDYGGVGPYAQYLFSRSGGFGPLEMVLSMRQQADWGYSLLGSTSPVLGKLEMLTDWGADGSLSKGEALTKARQMTPFASQFPGVWNKVFD